MSSAHRTDPGESASFGLSQAPTCTTLSASGAPLEVIHIGCGQLNLDFGATPNLFTDASGQPLVGDLQKAGVYHAAHASPPHIQVDPQVVVNVATCVTLGNETTDEIIDGWLKQGARIGIREYYGVYPWDFDLPGKAHMSDLGYLKKSLPKFHRHGARFLTAESSDNWGVTGLGKQKWPSWPPKRSDWG